MFRWNQISAVFGGSFDPPHEGHRVAAEGLLQHPGVKRVWVLPSGNPPWKNCIAAARDRLEMTKRAFGSGAGASPQIEVLDWEITLSERGANNRNSSEKTTTSAVLDWITPLAQGEPMAWVIGSDQFLSLEKWSQFPEVLGRCHWIVLHRKGSPGHTQDETQAQCARLELSGLIKRDLTGPNQWIIAPRLVRDSSEKHLVLVETEAPALSSTAIREKLARKAPPRELIQHGLLAPSVLDYLMEKSLYGTGKHDV
ncbi:MAG: hypothetical protein RJB38_315 [Pseudomonadota bacterium]